MPSPIFKDRSGRKIPETAPPVTPHARPKGASPVCQYCRLPVRLPLGRRFFCCPSCRLIAEHPPVFPDYLREGHVYCDWCGHWAVIEDYQTFATEEEFHAAVAAARAERQKEVTSDE